MQTTPLTIGLLVDSTRVSSYIQELVTWGQSNPMVNISHLIIQQPPSASRNIIKRLIRLFTSNRIKNVFNSILFCLIRWFESWRLKKYPIYTHHCSTYNIQQCVQNMVHITPLCSKSGLVYYYPEAEVAKVKALNLDLLIRCGSGILKGEILQATRLGILSFHHGDNRINRGGPAGFWEVYFKQDATGFSIQQLTEELDGGNVLLRGHFPTLHFFLLNQAILYKKSNWHLMHLLAKIAKTRQLPPFLPKQPYCFPLYKAPTFLEQCVYAAQQVRLFANQFISLRLLKKQSRWNVAFARKPWNELVMWKATTIPNPPKHFLADPFVITENGKDFCFVEDYDYEARLGRISVYELHEKSATRLGEALKEPFHLSFPYLFRFEGKIYLCPETSQKKEIRIYECIDFPLRWELRKVIMKNVHAADSMLFEQSGKWWLFTNLDPTNSGTASSELFIYYADSPLSDHWTPHAQNPVIIDSRKGRNGGLLIDEHSVYFRVGQKQRFNQYGAGFSINRITQLTPEHYAEETVCTITPDFAPKVVGTHHLHSTGNLSVFDYVKNTTFQK